MNFKMNLWMSNLYYKKNALLGIMFISLSFLALATSMSNIDVIDILSRVGVIAPSWIVNAITLAGSVAAVVTTLGTFGAGLPAAVLEQLAAASTAAA